MKKKPTSDKKANFSKKKEDFSAKKSFKNKPFKYNKRRKTNPLPKEDDGMIRLNRYLANAGICSRREADNLIVSGSVSINGEIVTELGTKVSAADTVHYGGELIKGQKKQYILLNKPKGYITTMDDPQGRKTVMDLVGGAVQERIYPVGRLDRATTGVLLLTNDGFITKRLTHPSSNVRKTYVVTLDKAFTKRDLIKLVDGVELEDGKVSVDKATYAKDGTDKKMVGLELHSGKNRVIRRMMETLGYQVVRLDRILFAGLSKRDLLRGRYRQLSEKEVGLLHRVAGLNKED